MRASRRTAIGMGISFPPALLRAARKRAASDRRGLSNYIQKLIADDIARAEAEAEPMAVNFATGAEAQQPTQG